MKRTLVLLLVMITVFSLSSCGEKVDVNADTSNINSSLEILETAWNKTDSNSKFYCVGGNISSGNAVENAPGNFGVDDAEALDNSLGFPSDSVSLIDDAASLMHGMNVNTFTAGAYHITDKENLDKTVKAIDENISNRQWMCGFPEVLIIITIDYEYVVSIFGNTELVENFKNQITEFYSNAVIKLDKNLL